MLVFKLCDIKLLQISGLALESILVDYTVHLANAVLSLRSFHQDTVYQFEISKALLKFVRMS